MCFHVVLPSSSIFQRHHVFFHSSFCILSVFTSKTFLDIVTFCFLHSYLSSFTSDFYEVFGVNDIFRRPFETWNSEIKTLSCLRLHFHLYFFSWGMKKDLCIIDHQRGLAWLRAHDKLQMGWGRVTGDGGRSGMRKCAEPQPLADWGTTAPPTNTAPQSPPDQLEPVRATN